MGGVHSTYGGEERCIQVLVRKLEGKRPLGRPRHRWDDNIKMDLQDVGWRGMDWTDLALKKERKQTLVNAVMDLWVELNSGNLLIRWEPVSFSRRTLLHGVSCLCAHYIQYCKTCWVLAPSLKNEGCITIFQCILIFQYLNSKCYMAELFVVKFYSQNIQNSENNLMFF